MNVSPPRDAGLSHPPLATTRRTPSDELKILEQSFKVGVFADPPAKKSLAPGADVFTKKHAQLLAGLRSEAARLSYDNQLVREKSATFERRYRVAKMDLVHNKEQLGLLQARYAKVRAELEASQHFMRQLDALFSGEKTQRLARAMSLPGEELEDARLLENLGETPHFEWVNPFERQSSGATATP